MIVDTDITKPVAWMLKDGAFESILKCKSEKDLNAESTVKTYMDRRIDGKMLDEFDKDFITGISVPTEYRNRYYLDLLSLKLFGRTPLGQHTVMKSIFKSSNHTIFGRYELKTAQAPSFCDNADSEDEMHESLEVDFLLFTALMVDEGAYVRLSSKGSFDAASPLVILDETIFECDIWMRKASAAHVNGYAAGQPGSNGKFMCAMLRVTSPNTVLSPRVLAILKASAYDERDIKSRFSLMVHKSMGWSVSYDAMITDRPEIDFNLNYNDDLPLEKIKKFITGSDGNNQLMAFHGESGTGKTTFIRWLSSEFPGTKFILLQGSELEYISDSSFVDVLQTVKGSVIVIEDCETLLAKRASGNSRIGTLLNLTDGIMGSAMRLKFICTFNTNKSNIDSALLRKGRMYLEYDFGKLSADRCIGLLEKIGKSSEIYKVTGPMALCDVYNIDSDNAGNVSRSSDKIGFGTK